MGSPRDVVLAWVDAFNRRDALAAAALYHEDVVNMQIAAGEPTIGRQAVLEELLAFFRAFPDNYTSPVNLLEDGEWAILEWTGGLLGRASSSVYRRTVARSHFRAVGCSK